MRKNVLTPTQIWDKSFLQALYGLWQGTYMTVQLAGFLTPINSYQVERLQSQYAQTSHAMAAPVSTAARLRANPALKATSKTQHAKMSVSQTFNPAKPVKPMFLQTQMQSEQRQHAASLGSLSYSQTPSVMAHNVEARVNALQTDVGSPAEKQGRQALRTLVGATAHVCLDNDIPSDVAFKICQKRVGRQGTQQVVNALTVQMKVDTAQEEKQHDPRVEGVDTQFFDLQRKEVLKQPRVKKAFKAYHASKQKIMPTHEVQEIVNGVYTYKLAYRKFHPDYELYPELLKKQVGGRTGGLNM